MAKTDVPAETLPVRSATLLVATMPVPASPSGGQSGIPVCSCPVGSSSFAPSSVSTPAASPAARTLGRMSGSRFSQAQRPCPFLTPWGPSVMEIEGIPSRSIRCVAHHPSPVSKSVFSSSTQALRQARNGVKPTDSVELIPESGCMRGSREARRRGRALRTGAEREGG